jgi:hypothetical protein
LLICSTSFFAYENSNYLFKVLNQEAATETVQFTKLAEGVDTFESITDLHFQQQQAVYRATGKIKDNRIVDYTLSISFANQEIMIKCDVSDEKIIYKAGEDAGEIKIEEPVFILDNNIIWFWQLVYDYYKANTKENIKVFIPQLLVKNMTELYTLEFETTSVVDEVTNIYFKLNGQSGMLKVNKNDQVIMMMMSGVIMERVE